MIDDKEIFIATPMYGGMCTAPYTLGMLSATGLLHKEGYKTSYYFLSNESLITRARNYLVDLFLNKTKAKYFLFIDADIGFCGDDVLKLVKSNKELICGLYPKKFIDWNRINIAAKNGLGDLQKYASSYVVNTVDLNESHNEPLQTSIVEVKHAGTGFMMIHRSVFEKLSPHVKEYRGSTLPNNEGKIPDLVKEFFALEIVGEDKYLLSEDYFFCELWRRHGGKVYADLSIKLSHFGSHEYKGDLIVGGSNQRGY